ncbi:PspC domain-containing protein [Paenibacillus sp. BR2-3]|uniref:PspC domain-containing protein n=1 Tax=Paenibacillus sp. BR2-3 TaxID=3048494 RepID=UPI003977D1A8
MTPLYRSTRDKVMTGLAGGLSETLGIDSTLARILLVVSIPFTGGTVIPVYFIAALIIPKEPTHNNPFGPGHGAPGSAYGGPYGGHYSDKNNAYSAPDSGLDAMMKDIEKKALKKEVEELKQKLSKYEKGEV